MDFLFSDLIPVRKRPGGYSNPQAQSANS